MVRISQIQNYKNPQVQFVSFSGLQLYTEGEANTSFLTEQGEHHISIITTRNIVTFALNLPSPSPPNALEKHHTYLSIFILLQHSLGGVYMIPDRLHSGTKANFRSMFTCKPPERSCTRVNSLLRALERKTAGKHGTCLDAYNSDLRIFTTQKPFRNCHSSQTE